MKNDPRYGTEVKIERERDSKSARISTRNPHAVDNVNVKQGPRMGNEVGGEWSADKRSEFRAAKAERSPLAKTIEDAYAKRQHEYAEYEYTNGGSIEDNVKARFKKSK